MARSTSPKPDPIEQAKRLTLIALFSDDELVDRFVLKGGNALNLAYGLTIRASVDLDLSMSNGFAPDELDDIRKRLTYRLQQTFRAEGLEPFDIKLQEEPGQITEDLAGFWGGYSLEFKILDADRFQELGGDIKKMRREAQITAPGQRKKIQVDISRYEQCDPKQAFEVDGYTVYVYTPLLLVLEKLRAICQQMPEYDPIVKRMRINRTARPRDFLDLHTLLIHFEDLDIDSDDARKMLSKVFEAKRVPLDLLWLIQDSYEQHASGWKSVEDTVRQDFELQPFDFYFDFVIKLADRLHPRGDV